MKQSTTRSATASSLGTQVEEVLEAGHEVEAEEEVPSQVMEQLRRPLAGKFHAKNVELFRAKSARMFQDNSARTSRGKNAEMFRD